eukprot:1087770-Karenia_brevis.AAC.1
MSCITEHIPSCSSCKELLAGAFCFVSSLAASISKSASSCFLVARKASASTRFLSARILAS